MQIYNAAEVSFQTQVGRTYQIQERFCVERGWENVGAPLQGTGDSMSYLTPTRSNVQQFYRVVSTPVRRFGRLCRNNHGRLAGVISAPPAVIGKEQNECSVKY